MGTRIKNLRLENNMTLEEIGNKVGVGKSTVRKWENGMIANMRRDKIAKLADALDVSPAYLMGWNESSAPAATIKLYNVHCDTEEESELILSYRKLNKHNQDRVLTYSQNLLSTQQMEEDVRMAQTRPDVVQDAEPKANRQFNTLAAHARTDVTQTQEGVQHDLDIMNDDSLWE